MPTTNQVAVKANTEIHQVSGIKVIGIWVVAMILRLWCRTVRFSVSPEGWRTLRRPEALVIMFWHNRLFFVPWAVRNARNVRPICGLVSASRDGANLARFFNFLGIRTVRGSSSRMGREALHKLIAVHREGCDIAVTPDGPRGPMYDMKKGAVLAARRTGSRMLLVGVRYQSAWRVKSWDQFLLPVPFSRASLHLQLVETDELRTRTDVSAWLRERLLTLSGEGRQG